MRDSSGRGRTASRPRPAARSPRSVLGEPVLLELADHVGKKLGRDRRGRTRGCRRCRAPRSSSSMVSRSWSNASSSSKSPGHEPEALGELAARPPRGTGARVLLDRVVHDLGEVLVGPVAAGEADQREAGRQQPAVGQVVDRRHQLLAGQVAGDAEDAPARTARRSAAAAGPAGRAAGCSPLGVVPQRSSQQRPAARDAGRPVGQVQPQHRPAVVGEHLRVAGGLGGDELGRT